MKTVFLKNGFIGIQILIILLISLVVTVPVLIMYFHLIPLMILISCTVLLLVCLLVIPTIAITYGIIITEQGVEVTWFRKSMKKFLWPEIIKVEPGSYRSVYLYVTETNRIGFTLTKKNKQTICALCGNPIVKERITEIYSTYFRS